MIEKMGSSAQFAVKMLQVKDLEQANAGDCKPKLWLIQVARIDLQLGPGAGVEEATKISMCSHTNLVSLREQFFHYTPGWSLVGTLQCIRFFGMTCTS